MVSGILRCMVVLLLFALHIDSKALSIHRQKRAPHPRLGRKRAIDGMDLSFIARHLGSHSGSVNFLQYPRQGRSNFFAYPRQGRSMPILRDGLEDIEDTCCPMGVKASWTDGELPDFQQLLCKCCDGLITRVLRQGKDIAAVCTAPQKISSGANDSL